MSELEQKLKKIYRVPLKPDLFGRRTATPKEIQQTINARFPDCLDQYLPNDEDVRLKDEGLGLMISENGCTDDFGRGKEPEPNPPFLGVRPPSREQRRRINNNHRQHTHR
jgi:hypothetical protein